jgi:hypothetical protein
MFKKKLGEMDFPAKVLFTSFLLVVSFGYIAALTNIYVSHMNADGKPGLSMNDIIITYYGDRGSTLLETKSLGAMRKYYDSDSDLNAVIGWIDSGSDRIEYEKVVAPIFKKSCIECHSARGIKSDAPLTSFEEVMKYVKVSKGVDIVHLSTLSHTHLISHSMMFFILSVIFLFTSVKDRNKIALIILAYIGIFGDVASWWLSKLAPIFAYTSVISGAILGITFLFFFFVPLYEMWLAKGR